MERILRNLWNRDTPKTKDNVIKVRENNGYRLRKIRGLGLEVIDYLKGYR